MLEAGELSHERRPYFPGVNGLVPGMKFISLQPEAPDHKIEGFLVGANRRTEADSGSLDMGPDQ